MDVSTPPYGRSCRPSFLEFCYKSGQVSADMWWWNEVIEAVDPTHIHLTSILYIYKVFDNLYMLWMCRRMCPHHVMAAHVYQAFWILLQIWASLSWYVMVKWGDWGYRPNSYSFQIHIIYKRCLTTFYMLRMCIWMCPHHVMATHVDKAFGISLQIWASLSWYVMVEVIHWQCSDRSSLYEPQS